MTIRELAIEKLGNYAHNSRTGELLESRVDRLCRAIEEFGAGLEIEVNNSWSKPPREKAAKKFAHLGGTTYKYQLWAVSR